MKMGCVNQVTLWIYVTYIMIPGKYSEEKVFAITGCNATLEWTLGNTSFDTGLMKVDVFNSSGIRIARYSAGSCVKDKNSPVDCIISNHGETSVLAVILIDVKPVNIGNYTGQMKYGPHKRRNITKNLISIDKPHIEKPQEIDHKKPLKITCTVEGKLDGVSYKWKLNDTDLKSTGRIYASSSTLTFDNPWTVAKSSIFSCEVCKDNSCCIASETFDLFEYYASAKPTSLENGNVDSKEPLRPQHNDGPKLKLLGMELVILAVFPIIVGFSILVMLRRKYISRRPDCWTLHQPLEGPARGEVHSEFIRVEKYNRPLPIPPEKENQCRRAKRLEYPSGHRKSRSLQTLSDHTKDIWNPARKSMSLQTVIKLSHVTGRCSKSDDYLSMACYCKKDSRFSVVEPANGIGLEELCSNVCIENNDDFSLRLLESQGTYKNLQQDQKNVDTGNSDYDYAPLPAV